MVSRGGRSRGCTNCRRRKVKCDEARPICLRCKKRNLPCDGPKEATWIYEDKRFTSQPSTQALVVIPSCPVKMSLIAFEEDICLAYTRKNLLRGGGVEIACNMIDFPKNASTFDRDPALALLRDAILSLSVTYFGTQHRQGRVISKGHHQYGAVLRQLNVALGDPNRQRTNTTILTALTCMLLEIFLPTGPANFLKHQRGIEALMTLRGPPKDSTGETAIIFRGLRVVSIIGALAESRPSIYAKEEWKRAPAVNTGDMGMLHHELFAVLAECTELMSECTSRSESEMIEEVKAPLLSKADRIIGQLNSLYTRWQDLNATELGVGQRQSPLAKELAIANHISATAYALYHMVHICIIQMKDYLSPSPSNIELRNTAAINIATCLGLKEYEQRQGGAESNTIAFVATQMAWQALGGFNTPEGRKLAQVVRSAVNGAYRSPWEQVGRGNLSLLAPSSPLFTRLNPIAMVQNGNKHPISDPPEIIDIGFKNGSPSWDEANFNLNDFA
ncbi:hypothetical protein FB567DRAFT_107256 [Paraphoma chrysanthemicola]|uniref:Zn(2)-C6 fungal-type domain-containing protein n=1 Tax=Paraphoma chrysanthemicola TaxID=798071 RepID=A0A8K0R169_9PLEO|nr:hypothetical protein FB567DRAFT_107256 [Paraphoma chrysanthemicola]